MRRKQVYPVQTNRPADCDIHYILERPFERIRRITGYLQKTGQWNNAKSAELKDRVKHGMER